jgi:hypothetical protein
MVQSVYWLTTRYETEKFWVDTREKEIFPSPKEPE